MVADNLVFVCSVFIVHPFFYILNRVAEKVCDNSGGMALAGAIRTVNPKRLVHVNVVTAHTAKYRAKYGVKLVVRNKGFPLPFFFFFNVVSGSSTTLTDYVVICCCHFRVLIICFLK